MEGIGPSGVSKVSSVVLLVRSFMSPLELGVDIRDSQSEQLVLSAIECSEQSGQSTGSMSVPGLGIVGSLPS